MRKLCALAQGNPACAVNYFANTMPFTLFKFIMRRGAKFAPRLFFKLLDFLIL